MRIEPVPDNDWQALNIAIEKISQGMQGQEDAVNQARVDIDRLERTVIIDSPPTYVPPLISERGRLMAQPVSTTPSTRVRTPNTSITLPFIETRSGRGAVQPPSTAISPRIRDIPKAPTNSTPTSPGGNASMAGYSPLIEHGQRRTRVSWATWPGINNIDITHYVVYASTETVCTIKDENIVSRNVTGTETSIILTPGVTYDIRVVPYTSLGSGIPSS